MAWILYLGLTGVSKTFFGGTAYATAIGMNLLDSLLMYAQWSVDLRGVAPDFGAERPGHSWLGGAWVLIVMTCLAWLLRELRRLPITGLVWWLVAISPVLPLLHQRHLHYLYAPSAGLALYLGSVVELLFLKTERSRSTAANARVGRYAAAGVLALLVLAYAALSGSLIRKRYEERLADIDLPMDAFVRKMEVARRATGGVGAALGNRATRVVFYNPLIRGRADFYTNLLPAVLDDGRALRAIYPTVDSVLFVRRWLPTFTAFDIFVANEDGRVRHFGRGPDANLRLIRTLAANGYDREAEDLLTSSVTAYPADPALRALYASTRRAVKETLGPPGSAASSPQ
jgi:hypothetical protein